MQNQQQAHMIFRQAMAYAAGAMAVNRVLTPQVTYRDFEPLPFIMNISFSVELLLKALLVFENCPAKGHKFDALLMKLSPKKQHEIRDLYAKERHYKKLTQGQFGTELKQISDIFSKWRYLFEPDKARSEIQMGHLISFANACVNANIINCPSWRRYRRIIRRAKGT